MPRYSSPAVDFERVREVDYDDEWEAETKIPKIVRPNLRSSRAPENSGTSGPHVTANSHYYRHKTEQRSTPAATTKRQHYPYEPGQRRSRRSAPIGVTQRSPLYRTEASPFYSDTEPRYLAPEDSRATPYPSRRRFGKTDFEDDAIPELCTYP